MTTAARLCIVPHDYCDLVVDFDLRDLALGTVVYVHGDLEARKFDSASTIPHPSAHAFGVVWISPGPPPVIYINDGLSIGEDEARKVCAATGKRLDLAQVTDLFRKLRRRIRLEHLYKSDEGSRSPIWPAMAVVERLDLCRRLSQLDWQSLLVHHDGLVCYLLLTCFDTLGNDGAWMDFASWLRSHRSRPARLEAEAASLPGFSASETAAHMHQAYLHTYGAAQAFRRFVRSVLPPEARSRLLGSIRIESWPYPKAGEQRECALASDAEKESFLYKIRNDFTHRSFALSGANTANVFPPDASAWRRISQKHCANGWMAV